MLTDTAAKNAKRKDRPYKLSDRDGLYLYVSATGARSWRYDYRYAGKRYTLTHGPYPEVSLGEARDRHGMARKALERGQNPSLVKRQERLDVLTAAGNTFEAVAKVWYEGKAKARSASWRENASRWLARDIYPAIGALPIAQVLPADVLQIMRKKEADGKAKSGEYIRQIIAQVYDFAIANLKADSNPARLVRGAIHIPPAKSRVPLTEKEIPQFLESLDAYPGRLATKLAAKLLMLTFVRKMELVEAKRDEIDLDKALWRIPAERMKMSEPHTVPLSRQAVEAFREVLAMDFGSPYVFPNLGRLDKPMGASTLNKVFDQIGFGHFTPHGLRATASTILNEHGWRPDVIERQLAHTERNKVRAAYNKAEYLDERRDMMQQWADHIDALSRGANVTPIRRQVANG